MAVCDWRTLLLVICFLELVVTIQRQVFDFMGFMWLPIIANFVNIILIIFGCFGAVQYITKYLLTYAIWCFIWLTWNIFLICYYLNIGNLNRESGFLSLGTGSVSWWETNGWGCQPVWRDVEEESSWRPTRVDGCLLFWPHVELAQSSLAALLSALALPLVILQTYKKVVSPEKKIITRQPVYTIELSPTDNTVSESSLKPMTPRRVKRRSGSRGAGSSVRRSRRSYRNAGYLASSSSLPRDPRTLRPTSAHSSYSNFHAARPASYHVPDVTHTQDIYDPPPPSESVPVLSGYDTASRGGMSPGYDVVGPYNDRMYEQNRGYDTKMQIYENRNVAHDGSVPNYPNVQAERVGSPSESSYNVNPYGEMYPVGSVGSWDTPPPPAPPYASRATPQAPGPPAYQANEHYNMPS